MKRAFSHEGFDFIIEGVHPHYKCFLVVDEKHYICQRRTQKECHELVETKTHDQIAEALNLKIEREKKNAEFPAKQMKFLNLFKFMAPIDMHSRYFFLTHRISIIQLDQMLRVPDGISTSDFIKEKYGKEAVDLVKSMM